MSLNIAGIKGRAKAAWGRDISEQEAQDIMNSTRGGDEGEVANYLQSRKTVTSGGGGDESSDLISEVTKLITEALDFDEPAARKIAEDTLGEYYDEVLEDYLAEVKISKKRDKDDLATDLKALLLKGTRGKEDLDEILDAYGIKEKRTKADLKTNLETLGISKTRTTEDLTTRLDALGLRDTRSKEDLKSTLGLLSGRREDYLADVKRESPKIQEAIGGRAADRNLFFSGGREEKQRLQLEKEARDVKRYETEYGYQTGQAELGATRTTEDVGTAETAAELAATRTKQDIAKKETATKLVEARTQEGIQKQELLEQQRYDRDTENIATQKTAQELQSTRYLEDVERQKKERERDLAQQREQAVTGSVDIQRSDKEQGYY